MNILVIGSGGREHALVWKLSQGKTVKKIFCAPGNAGIAQIAECVPIAAEDIGGLLEFAKKNAVDLTVVGPEAPLVAGIVDRFESAGLKAFGPRANAAIMEGSKAFSKDLMKRYGIPTAGYEVFTEHDTALAYLEKAGAPIVIKADGLAAGKGAIVCMDIDSARLALRDIMVDRVFKEAGDRVVIEEFLEGEEASILAFTDSRTIIPMASAQDHKRAFDNDEGPNTGGMGAYSPAPVMTDSLSQRVYDEILLPTMKAMDTEGRPYKGLLYAGLMITKDGPKVVEFNCRFGDPETQAVLPRMDGDLAEVMMACVEERLDGASFGWKAGAAVCIVMASGGYPGHYEKGKVITGLNALTGKRSVVVFHAGTKAGTDGTVVTSGGRVLGVTALGKDIRTAITAAYKAVSAIQFSGGFYRRDIGARALIRRQCEKYIPHKER